jgi:hypothetical protein
MTKVDIAPCKARIRDDCMKRYVELYRKKKQKDAGLESNRNLIEDRIESTSSRAAVSLEYSKVHKRSRLSSVDSLSSTIRSNSCRESTPNTGASASKNSNDLVQMKNFGGPNPHGDTKLTMAIADFIHCCGLPF